MIEERRLSKTEARLGLSLIAGLLVALGCVVVDRLRDAPTATHAGTEALAAQPAEPTAAAVQQTSYRPEWLPPQDPRQPTLIR